MIYLFNMSNRVFYLLLALLPLCLALPVNDVESLISTASNETNIDHFINSISASVDLDQYLDPPISPRDSDDLIDPYPQPPYTNPDTLQEFFDTILTKRTSIGTSTTSTSTHTQTLHRRKCVFNTETAKWDCDDNLPTMSEMVSQMRDQPGGTANRGRLAAFYVNLRDDPALQKGGNDEEAKLVAWCEKNGLRDKFYWWANCVNKHWLEAQAKHLRDNREKIAKAHPEWGPKPDETFLKGIFQAMAFAAQQPTALLFTKKGEDWSKNTIWQEVEFPTITRNKNVKQILRVDPTCMENKPEVLWSRARRDPLPPVVFEYPDMR